MDSPLSATTAPGDGSSSASPPAAWQANALSIAQHPPCGGLPQSKARRYARTATARTCLHLSQQRVEQLGRRGRQQQPQRRQPFRAACVAAATTACCCILRGRRQAHQRVCAVDERARGHLWRAQAGRHSQLAQQLLHRLRLLPQRGCPAELVAHKALRVPAAARVGQGDTQTARGLPVLLRHACSQSACAPSRLERHLQQAVHVLHRQEAQHVAHAMEQQRDQLAAAAAVGAAVRTSQWQHLQQAQARKAAAGAVGSVQGGVHGRSAAACRVRQHVLRQAARQCTQQQ